MQWRVRERPASISPTVSGCVGSGEGGMGWRPNLLLTSVFPSAPGASARARGASGMGPPLGRAGEGWGETGGRVR